MSERARHGPALRASLIGSVGLATAMGIGRFAFTPMMPLMQGAGSITLGEGGELASANYLGYLCGALLAFALDPRPVKAASFGLAAIALSTLAMALTSSLTAWLAFRLIAGIASAFVLVGIVEWSLAALTAARQAAWSGWVFAGVGAGILFAGLAALAIGAIGLAPEAGWLVLGAAAALAAVLVARSIAGGTPRPSPTHGAMPTRDALPWRLIICYGAFGFGYIIPATFLPAAARAMIGDPAVFGWIWPVFGLAAAISTVLAASLLRGWPPRRVWAYAQLLMAAGVALPAIKLTLLTLAVSGACVGGTFMVITMAGMQEARRVGGPSPLRLMAGMTTAFALGQLIGPLTVPAALSAAEAIPRPSLLAAGLLLATGLALFPAERVAREPRLDRNRCRVSGD